MSDESVIAEDAPPELEPTEMSRAEMRIKELLTAKASAEAATQAEARARAAAEARYEEAVRQRSATVEPEPDEWSDPAERHAKAAMKMAEEARKIAQDNADTNRRQQAAMSIDRAMAGHNDWLHAESTKNRLAERYFLAQAHGREFDASAEAETLHTDEQNALGARKEAWAKTKATQAAATASAMSSPSPPTPPKAEDRPAWGTPERAAYDTNIELEILAAHRR